jgi:hypothetical protein
MKDLNVTYGVMPSYHYTHWFLAPLVVVESTIILTIQVMVISEAPKTPKNGIFIKASTIRVTDVWPLFCA